MDLAIFTGRSAFEEPQYLGKPHVEKETQRRFYELTDQVFAANYFTNNGPLLQKLEFEIAKLHNVNFCTLVCNGTIAQILLLRALGLKGEVILPSFTFIATAHACKWGGVTPVFCDISAKDFLIDANKVEGLISAKTEAIIGVHLFGNLFDVHNLSAIADRHGLSLIADSAHTFGCSRSQKCSYAGLDAEFMSFHATKFFSTFEGGAVLTDDAELDKELRLLRNFGFRGYDNVGSLGINGKMNEISAAMGLASLHSLSKRKNKLQETYELYSDLLRNISGISCLEIGQRGESNYQYFVISVDERKFGVSRNLLCDLLWKENIIVRKYFYPGCHEMEPYRSSNKVKHTSLAVTEKVCNEVLCLPVNFPDPRNDVRVVAEKIELIHENASKLRIWKTVNQ